MIEKGEPVALGREDDTTNIRMEGLALIAAMELLDGKPGEVHTDSEFWVNVLTKWADGWAKRGWTKPNGPIKNLEIVQKVYALYLRGNVTLVWEKAHVGTEMNEAADKWANKARKGATI